MDSVICQSPAQQEQIDMVRYVLSARARPRAARACNYAHHTFAGNAFLGDCSGEPVNQKVLLEQGLRRVRER